ncbi:MAG: hypothetical protein ACRC4M_03415 [Mycoplasma sp.]
MNEIKINNKISAYPFTKYDTKTLNKNELSTYNKKILNVFKKVVKDNKSEFQENLMKIYLKSEATNPEGEFEKLIKTTEYGWILGKPNLKLDSIENNMFKESIYGFIYINKWGDKDEISFWIQKNYRDLTGGKFKFIVKKFTDEWFGKKEIQYNRNLIWGTRYKANKSNYFAHCLKFKFLFSFYDYIDEFVNLESIDNNDHNIKGMVLTNYFFSNKNNYLYKNQLPDDTGICEGFDVNNPENLKLFNAFENIVVKPEAKTVNGRILKVGIESYFMVPNHTNKTLSKETNENKFQWEAFNICLDSNIKKNILNTIIELDEESGVKGSILKQTTLIRVVFHIKTNCIQIICFNKDLNIYSKVIRNFERFMENENKDSVNPQMVNSILHNNLTIITADKKTGSSSYVSSLVDSLQYNKSNEEDKLMVNNYVVHNFLDKKGYIDEYISFEKFLNKYEDFRIKITKKKKTKKTSKAIKYKKEKMINMHDKIEFFLTAAISLLTSYLVGIISSNVFTLNRLDIIILISVVSSVLGILILFMFSFFWTYPKHEWMKLCKFWIIRKFTKLFSTNKKLKRLQNNKSKSIFIVDNINDENFRLFRQIAEHKSLFKNQSINIVCIFSGINSNKNADNFINEISKNINVDEIGLLFSIEKIHFAVDKKVKEKFANDYFMTQIYSKNKGKINYDQYNKSQKLINTQESKNIGRMFSVCSLNNCSFFIPEIDKDITNKCFQELAHVCSKTYSYEMLEDFFCVLQRETKEVASNIDFQKLIKQSLDDISTKYNLNVKKQ